MMDYVNKDHGLETIKHNFSCKAHGKGIYNPKEVWFGLYVHSLSKINFFTIQFMTAYLFFFGGDKTDASSALTHRKTIDIAYNLYLYL